MATTDTGRKNKRELNGLLLLDKPVGVTSNQALQRVKWLLRAKKAGHTGTLDPLATGLLPICLGEATKFSRFQLEANKRYLVTARFGAVSDSGDCEGQIVLTDAALPANEAIIREATTHFIGEIDQRPPLYSAIKKAGRRLCDYAREGVTVEPELRRVQVSQFELNEYRGGEARFEISCSKGTYVRSLIADLGELLGCGAYVARLRRIESGGLSVEQAVSLSELEAIVDNDEHVLGQLRPMDTLLAGVAKLELTAEQANRLLMGQIITISDPGNAGSVALYAGGQFIGVGDVNKEGVVRPKRLLRH